MATKTIRLTKGETYLPQQAVSDDALPEKFANYPFVYVHYPMGWVFDDAAGFLPELSEIQAKPGVNGVGKDGRLSRPIGGAIQKGGTIIDPADRRLGDWKNYLVTYPVVGGRKHHCFRSAAFTILPGGRVHAGDGSEDYNAFRAFVRDEGVVAPMENPVFMALMDRESRGYNRVIRDAVKLPHLAPLADAKKARMAAMRAAWAKMNPPELVTDAAEVDPTPPVATGKKGPMRLAPAPASPVDTTPEPRA